MDMKKLLPFICIVLSISACQKKVVTKPVEFTETTYKYLGTWNDGGKPDYLFLPRDTISDSLTSYINTLLPETVDLRTSHPEYLNTDVQDIRITQSSNVVVTFVYENTTLHNALAFYTYPTTTPPTSAKDIKEITYIFPNAGSNTRLKPGDRVNIGRFEPGTSIGFVILQDAWKVATKTLDSSSVHFCSNDVLNPEVDPALKKHAILIEYPAEHKTLIGFEDVDRTSKKCDHDFNDIVIYATVNP